MLALGALGALGGALAYRAVLRDPVLHWGARPDEVMRRLPGDELLEDAELVSTRAVTIDAPTSAIWPWLIQMGPGRAGAYTYDWIENLFGLNMHSSDTIVPEWQSMQVGDAWRLGKDQSLRAEIVEPEQALVVRSEDGRWVWSFVLVPEGDVTRLLSRNRITVKGGVLPAPRQHVSHGARLPGHGAEDAGGHQEPSRASWSVSGRSDGAHPRQYEGQDDAHQADDGQHRHRGLGGPRRQDELEQGYRIAQPGLRGTERAVAAPDRPARSLRAIATRCWPPAPGRVDRCTRTTTRGRGWPC